MKQGPEQVLLVGLILPDGTRSESRECLDELELLARTAGGEPVNRVLLSVPRPRPATLIGQGQAEDLQERCQRHSVDLVIFDEDLSPAQSRNLERLLDCRVMERAGLILDIFAARARTRAGKLQVSLAQHVYLLPRLTRLWTHLSRLGGGIGTRGPGETQLEMDRRVIRRKILKIRQELDRVRRHRKLHRSSRQAVPVPTVALVGYTNAGKSTLFRSLTGTDTLVEDRLFATLDPLTRRLKLPRGGICLLSDTVGFIRKLPHQLVEAFKATLEELLEADLLIHVVDASHPGSDEQIRAVETVLDEIGAAERPRLTALNKVDLLPDLSPPGLDASTTVISALAGTGLEELTERIEANLSAGRRVMELLLPLDRGDLLARIIRAGRVIHQEYRPEGISLRAELPRELQERLRPFEALVAPKLDSSEGSQEDIATSMEEEDP